MRGERLLSAEVCLVLLAISLAIALYSVCSAGSPGPDSWRAVLLLVD